MNFRPFQFQIYNAILRRWPRDVYGHFESAKNLFTTSIHVLVSAVQKLSRQVRLADGTLLYRGLGGELELPEGFWRSDARGRRGYKKKENNELKTGVHK